MKDFWNREKSVSSDAQSGRSSDEALLLPLIVLLLNKEENRMLIMALLYILS